MIYVYDMVMNEKRITSFKRYGARYKLEKKFVMGDRTFYSFIAPGMEKILVVPGFAEMYRELEVKLSKYTGGTDFDSYKKWIQKNINHYVTVEDFPTEESSNGIMRVVSVDYKDIRATFEYLNDSMRIGQEFEIRDNNIFGNGIVVLMNMNMEEA